MGTTEGLKKVKSVIKRPKSYTHGWPALGWGYILPMVFPTAVGTTIPHCSRADLC